jgi:hypothetical protein
MMGRLSGQIPRAMFITGVTYSLADLYHAHQQIDSPPSPSGIH